MSFFIAIRQKGFEMGYYTRYSLDIDDFEETVPSCNHKTDGFKFCPECGVKIESLSLYAKIEKDLVNYENEDGYDGKFILGLLSNDSDGTKWYDHEKHMKELSKKYPKALFTLSGEGEEGGDIWKKYFMNGKVQIAKAEIVVEAFNKNKLK